MLSRFSMRTIPCLMVAVLLGACHDADSPVVQHDAEADQLYQLCTQCHGQQLQGNPEIAAPAVAGLPEWYIVNQLRKFKEGVRGTHFDDIAGMRMRPMAMSLTMGDIDTIAGKVASMDPHEGQPVLDGGDAARGKTLFTPCTACHGPKADGNQQLNAPPLTQSPDWYLLTQLKNFKHGARGANPKDTTGAQMRPMAQGLPDEQAMRDVIAYISTL